MKRLAMLLPPLMLAALLLPQTSHAASWADTLDAIAPDHSRVRFVEATDGTIYATWGSKMNSGDHVPADAIYLGKWNASGERLWIRSYFTDSAHFTVPGSFGRCLAYDPLRNRVYLGYSDQDDIATEAPRGLLAVDSSGVQLFNKSIVHSGDGQINDLALAPISGTIFVAGFADHLISAYANTGDLLWEYHLPDSAWGTIRKLHVDEPNGHLFAWGQTDTSLIALKQDLSGQVLASFELSLELPYQPQAWDHAFDNAGGWYLAGEDSSRGFVARLDTSDLSPTWVWRNPQQHSEVRAIDLHGNTVYAGGRSGPQRVILLEQSSGSQLASLTYETQSFLNLNDLVVLSDSTIWGAAYYNRRHTVRWTADGQCSGVTPGQLLAEPSHGSEILALSDGTVLMGSYDVNGSVYVERYDPVEHAPVEESFGLSFPVNGETLPTFSSVPFVWGSIESDFDVSYMLQTRDVDNIHDSWTNGPFTQDTVAVASGFFDDLVLEWRVVAYVHNFHIVASSDTFLVVLDEPDSPAPISIESFSLEDNASADSASFALVWSGGEDPDPYERHLRELVIRTSSSTDPQELVIAQREVSPDSWRSIHATLSHEEMPDAAAFLVTIRVSDQDGFVVEADNPELVYWSALSDLPLPQGEFNLAELYPNPFNPTLTATVALPRAAELSVAVYDLVGRRVARLAQGRYEAGRHSLVFDGSELASGVYFVRAVVPGELNTTSKVVLMK